MIPRKAIEAARSLAHVDKQSLSFLEETRLILRILKEAVDADTANLGSTDYATGEGVHVSLDGFLMPEKRVAILPRFIDQHPMMRFARLHGEHPPLRFSDFMSRRQFEETALYKECYEGYTHSMVTFTVPAPSGLNVSFVLSRNSADFTDEECDILAILQPQIQVFLHNALLRRSVSSIAASAQADQGVIVGAGNRMLLLDDKAHAIWSRHFGPHRFRLPLSLSRLALRGGLFEQTHPTYGKVLCACFTGSLEDWTLLLWENQDPAHVVNPWGLTSREKEIGSWLVKGKSQAEIAVLLGISVRTIHKHTESLYRKLGVENQVAAIQELSAVFQQQYLSVISKPLPHAIDRFILRSTMEHAAG